MTISADIPVQHSIDMKEDLQIIGNSSKSHGQITKEQQSGYTTSNNWERSAANLLPLTIDQRRMQKYPKDSRKTRGLLQAKKEM